MTSWFDRIGTASQVYANPFRQTFTKKVGEFTLACEPMWYMGDQSELNPEEEEEAIKSLEGTLSFLKMHPYTDSLRQIMPIKVETKNNKIVMCTVSTAYWDAWEAELARRKQEEIKEKVEKVV